MRLLILFLASLFLYAPLARAEIPLLEAGLTAESEPLAAVAGCVNDRCQACNSAIRLYKKIQSDAKNYRIAGLTPITLGHS